MKALAGLFLTLWATVVVAEPLVIAHRGASGYLPEHTLAAHTMAYAQGADYLEADLVLSADGHPVVLHDLTLDAVTDVRERFPGRAREDGLHYVVDFDLAELRQLRIHERIDPESGEPRFPGRFPADHGRFGVITLEELIELTQGLNAVTGREVGIYPEIKSIAFHEAAGHDFVAILMRILDRYGYRGADTHCIIQSFDPAPLMRLRDEFDTDLRLVQLLGENAWGLNDIDYDPMYTGNGLVAIADYADGIGPPIHRMLDQTATDDGPAPGRLMQDAGAAGLEVHPYTLRADSLPAGVEFGALAGLLFTEVGVDGIFTDHPDRAVAALRALRVDGSVRSSKRVGTSPE